jgi:hypothetical protein
MPPWFWPSLVAWLWAAGAWAVWLATTSRKDC